MGNKGRKTKGRRGGGTAQQQAGQQVQQRGGEGAGGRIHPSTMLLVDVGAEAAPAAHGGIQKQQALMGRLGTIQPKEGSRCRTL